MSDTERKDKDEYLKALKKHNETIKKYRDEMRGWLELTELLSAFIYTLLCGKGETVIYKSDIAEGLEDYACDVCDNGDYYTVSVRKKGSTVMSVNEKNEKKQI